MKICINEREVYPVFPFRKLDHNSALGGTIIDVDKEKVKEWNKIVSDYNKLQKELQTLLDNP